MSSHRKLSGKIEWEAETRIIELLDWESKSEDFDRLFEHVITQLIDRDGVTRERLFTIIGEPELRGEVRAAAERFQEKDISLVLFIYLRLKFLVLPRLASGDSNANT